MHGIVWQWFKRHYTYKLHNLFAYPLVDDSGEVEKRKKSNFDAQKQQANFWRACPLSSYCDMYSLPGFGSYAYQAYTW